MSKHDRFAPFRAAYKAEALKHNGPKYWRSLEHKAAADDGENGEAGGNPGSCIPVSRGRETTEADKGAAADDDDDDVNDDDDDNVRCRRSSVAGGAPRTRTPR